MDFLILGVAPLSICTFYFKIGALKEYKANLTALTVMFGVLGWSCMSWQLLDPCLTIGLIKLSLNI